MEKWSEAIPDDAFTPAQLWEIYRGYDSGVDVSMYRKREYKQAQMRQIRLGLEHKLDENEIGKYMNPNLSSLCMEIIRSGIEKGYDVDLYRDAAFDPNQMWEVYSGFENGLKKSDIVKFADSNFTADQMRQIRLGLEQGLSVEIFANPNTSAGDMERARLRLSTAKKDGFRGKLKKTLDVWRK